MNLWQMTSKHSGKIADPIYHELAEVVQTVMKGLP